MTRTALLSLLSTSALVIPAWSQDVIPERPAGAADTTDEIVVTGSRIIRTELESPQPIQAVGETDILLSGDVNIVDVVDDLPALIGSATTAQNTAQGNLGAATLDLRNLGAERTLVLVDGKRHVAGLAGSSSVDVNTIPAALVERVEVLTGGAAAVYGADAVTGVVNFIMKDDFDGFDVRGQFSSSAEGDAFTGYVSGTYGRNFDDGRGNATLSLSYDAQDSIQYGDRDFSRGDRVATDWPNPARIIQASDIAQFGIDPLLLGNSILDFCGTGELGAGEDALCARANGAPGRAVLPFPRFNLTSYGSLIGVDFFGDGFLSYYPGTPFTDIFGSDLSGLDLGSDGVVFDLNNNGVEDCLETVNGTINQQFFGFAGCHITRLPGSGADVFQDGLLAGNENAFGGDGTFSGRDGQDLIPQDQRFVANFRTNYEVSPFAEFFVDAKFAYSKTEVDTTQAVGGFYDSLGVGLDNPFVPANLRGAIETFVGDNDDVFDLDNVLVFIGRDMTDLGYKGTESERTTYRLVGGVRGEIADTTLRYEVSGNYGRTQADSTSFGNILQDRFYAAVDVTTDVNGNPVCRSELDPNAEPIGSFLRSGGPFRGFLTYEPGTGLCQPLNIFGVGAPDQAAIDFVTTDIERKRTIEQTVFNAFVAGDTSQVFELPGGAIGFALGAEYRDESSSFEADPLERPREDPIGQLDATQLIFPVDGPTANISGGFDVWEVFTEASLPLIADMPAAELLQLDAAYRYSEYDTLGGADAWNLGLIYAPNSSLRFRGSRSQTVRAPNVNELFSPLQSTTSRPTDPCDAGEIGSANGNRAINCAADGIPAGFTDPLTARVGGFTGGNPDLEAETADTLTYGVVITPSVVPGFSVTVDYYSIEIEDAIQSVGLQEILNACYDGSPEGFATNQFCSLFERDRDPNSATPLGISTFRSQEINFAAVETAGIDFQVDYGFDLGDVSASLADAGSISTRVVGNRVLKLERFEDPVDDTIVNDRLYEVGQPRLAVNVDLRWSREALTVGLQSRYLGKFLEITPRLQVENASNFENAWTGDLWRHDLSATYQVSDTFTLYGGVNNLTDEQPIATSLTYPYGAIGRQFFVGANASF